MVCGVVFAGLTLDLVLSHVNCCWRVDRFEWMISKIVSYEVKGLPVEVKKRTIALSTLR